MHGINEILFLISFINYEKKILVIIELPETIHLMDA